MAIPGRQWVTWELGLGWGVRHHGDCVCGRAVEVRWKWRGCVVRDRDGGKREILRNIYSHPPPHIFQDGSPKFEGETCEEIKEVRLRGRERDFSIFQKLGLRPLSLASYPALEFLPGWMLSGAMRRETIPGFLRGPCSTWQVKFWLPPSLLGLGLLCWEATEEGRNIGNWGIRCHKRDKCYMFLEVLSLMYNPRLWCGLPWFLRLKGQNVRN